MSKLFQTVHFKITEITFSPYKTWRNYILTIQTYNLSYCTFKTLHFLQTEGLWQPYIKQDYWHHFSNSICLLPISVLHFGNSCNISRFFISIIFVVVICDQRSLMLLPLLVKVAAAAAKSLQSCPTLCDPIDSSPPGSTIPGILQARTLEWVAISLVIHKQLWLAIQQ